jgi:mRNA interferase MazF
VWLDSDPQSGREQAGRRTAFVVSHASYNHRVGLAPCCPVTSRVKGYPFEVRIPAGMDVDGVVLADQLRSLEWRSRRASFIGEVPGPTVDEVSRKVMTLIR